MSELMTLNDPEPAKYAILVFLAISGCDTHFKNELRQNGWR